MSLLAVAAMAKAFNGVPAVSGIGFSLQAGEMLALIGPNGAGKSTTFNMINGQLRPTSGSIRIFGRETAGWSPRRIARLGVGRTFQITATFGSMSVLENVQMALIAHHKSHRKCFARAKNLFVTEARALLDLVGMGEAAARACAELAYGDLKRLELAIALANDPKLLLMDEPVAGMAPAERTSLMRLTAKLARDRAMGVLFTEHDMDVVFAHADRIMVLNRGVLIASGTPAEVRADPKVRDVYLGGGTAAHIHAGTAA